MKILVIEDDPSIRELLTEFLQSEGHYVKALGDTPQVDCETLGHFDRVILDLTLPSDGAWEWAKNACKQVPSSQVVVTTAATGSEIAERAKEGGYRFLAKPFTLDTVRCVLE